MTHNSQEAPSGNSAVSGELERKWGGELGNIVNGAIAGAAGGIIGGPLGFAFGVFAGAALGFFVTVIAIVAIVFGKEDVAKMAIKVHSQIAKLLSSQDSG